MDRGSISGRYAVALYKYAHKYGKEKCIYDETIVLSKKYLQYPALKRVLANPVLPVKKKEETLILTMGDKGKVSPEWLNFIRLLLKQKREGFLQTICLNYQDIYRREKKLLHVRITTAVPVDKKTEREIIQRLERLTHETVDIEAKVDPAIIGGYIMYWDTYRWDASVSCQLGRIKQQLKLK